MVISPRCALITVISAFLLISGCASKDSHLVGDAGYQSPCPRNLTPACYEYMGKKLRCYCSTRDGLREIFEPREPY